MTITGLPGIANLLGGWQLFFPIGVIGGISWSVWLVRKLVSMRHRPLVNAFRSTTSVVVPSFREDPDVLDRCLDTWLGQDPTEVIVVLDLADVEARDRLIARREPRPGCPAAARRGRGPARRLVAAPPLGGGRKGAELRLQAPGTLRMVSDRFGFTSLVAFKGVLLLAGEPTAPLRITSWDPVEQTADTEPRDGRAYLRAVGARMDLAHVELADVGFWSGRTGGLAWTGSAGGAATGSATAVTVERSHYGLFASRTEDLALTDSAFRDNDLDGVLLHRAATGPVARGVTSTGNGRNGIAVARGARDVVLSEVVAGGNVADGIRIDGSALAEEANPGGASTARGTGYTVEQSTASGNGGAGVLVNTADRVRLVGNTVSGSPEGIVLQGGAASPVVSGNSVDAAELAIAVRGGTQDAQITANRVGSALIGIQVADATATVAANTVAAASRYAVSLVGAVDGSAVTENALSGRGLRAVDLNRLAATAAVGVAGNDETGWVADRDDLRYWGGYVADHPLLLLWLLILLVPAAARLRARRRDVPARPHPYHGVMAGSPCPEPAGPDLPAATPPISASPVTRVSVVSGEGAVR